MKTIVISLFLAALMFTSCSNETKVAATDVPPAVSAALMEKYPDANDIEWELEKEDDHLIYEAEFKSGGKKKEAEFGSDGTFIKED